MSSGKNISAVIPTYNSATHLSKCLESIKWVDQIIVIDMGSTDATLNLAKKYKANIFFKQPKDGNFDLNRKFGMLHANTEWILKIDSDEVLTQELQEEIREKLNSDSHEINGYFLKNKIYMFGSEIKHGFIRPNSKEMRLFRKDKWQYNPFKFHQQIEIKGKTETLNEYYLHYNYTSVSEFIKKTNRYTTLDSLFLAKNTKITLTQAVSSPFKSFIKLFFIQLGFLDGDDGFKVSFLFSLYNLIEKVKIWEIKYKND